jgi:hypothetical protein
MAPLDPHFKAKMLHEVYQIRERNISIARSTQYLENYFFVLSHYHLPGQICFYRDKHRLSWVEGQGFCGWRLPAGGMQVRSGYLLVLGTPKCTHYLPPVS